MFSFWSPRSVGLGVIVRGMQLPKQVTWEVGYVEIPGPYCQMLSDLADLNPFSCSNSYNLTNFTLTLHRTDLVLLLQLELVFGNTVMSQVSPNHPRKVKIIANWLFWLLCLFKYSHKYLVYTCIFWGPSLKFASIVYIMLIRLDETLYLCYIQQY